MVDRRLCFAILAITLFVSVLHAERARNDNRQDDEEAIDFASNNDRNNEDDFIETIKRFLGKHKKTTTKAPTSDSILALITTTSASRVQSTTKDSVFGGMFGKKTSGSSISKTTGSSRTSVSRQTTKSPKDGCGLTNPCKNGGTCKTLSSGNYYCFCSQDYYGKTCDNKFMSTGAANNDRARKDHCASSPCRNGGECVGLRTTFYCRCKSPHYGISCDKKLGVKREQIDEESMASEQDLHLYERELQEDTEDLRRALANEDISENNE
ncbi:unnamed protein product [Adineta steineri]|uniref:EGF-like domain-containing protein n=1 Tax=Adineta steineri TaxID=433720 RepID=A0A819JTI7_9BILA|nr:unnamed protein product [Adineta steineri]CAF3932887.1 unnamed protein product [Adineta steineri]